MKPQKVKFGSTNLRLSCWVLFSESMIQMKLNCFFASCAQEKDFVGIIPVILASTRCHLVLLEKWLPKNLWKKLESAKFKPDLFCKSEFETPECEGGDSTWPVRSKQLRRFSGLYPALPFHQIHCLKTAIFHRLDVDLLHLTGVKHESPSPGSRVSSRGFTKSCRPTHSTDHPWSAQLGQNDSLVTRVLLEPIISPGEPLWWNPISSLFLMRIHAYYWLTPVDFSQPCSYWPACFQMQGCQSSRASSGKALAWDLGTVSD